MKKLKERKIERCERCLGNGWTYADYGNHDLCDVCHGTGKRVIDKLNDIAD